jgi:hypothetical protein
MKVGIPVHCTVCKRTKAPHGRSVPPPLHDSMCTFDQCIGYGQDPLIGDLWPGETEEEFGFPVSSAGTREMPDA